MNDVRTTPGACCDDAALDLGAFIRDLAHDIANPLNAISMNAELARLLLDRDQPARAREAIGRLLEDCARCGRFIQGIQRFGSGLHAHAHETMSVHALVSSAMQLAGGERIAGLPEVRIEGDDIPIRADRPALERALAGLLHNAAEAGADDIQVHIGSDADAVLIEVRDNGGGVAPESVDKLAKPFYSTRRGEGGSGLGLTLARELLRAHGGGMRITPNVPRGTCVELRLPATA
jgi:signal transduction histidine kinase